MIAKPAFEVTTYPFSTQELHSLYGEEFVKRMNEKRIGAEEFALLKNFRGWGQPDRAVEQMLSGRSLPHQGLLDPDHQHAGGPGGRHQDALRGS